MEGKGNALIRSQDIVLELLYSLDQGLLDQGHQIVSIHISGKLSGTLPSANQALTALDEGDAIDLSALPIQTCWPGDAGPLITWGLVVTKGPHKERQNLGIYRQQVIGRNKVIMRWLRPSSLCFSYLSKSKLDFPFNNILIRSSSNAPFSMIVFFIIL